MSRRGQESSEIRKNNANRAGSMNTPRRALLFRGGAAFASADHMYQYVSICF